MPSAYENEDLPLPARRRAAAVAAEDDIPLRRDFRSVTYDRMRPSAAGALSGAFGGAAALAVVHAIHLTPIGNAIARLTAAAEIPSDASFPIAYVAAALVGAIVGAGFASVTRHLRRFVPLVIWALVFFGSLTMLLLAVSSTYGRGVGVSMAPAILIASAAFAVVASFQLPLRRRSPRIDD